jgi:hypothetical protein
VAVIRLSVDALEPEYSSIRSKPLAAIANLLDARPPGIRFGINCVVRPGKVRAVEGVLDFAVSHRLNEFLFIPLHNAGTSTLAKDDLEMVRRMVEKGRPSIAIRLSGVFGAGDIPVLPVEGPLDFVFAHISADMYLRSTSYSNFGLSISSSSDLERQCRTLYLSLRREQI